MANLLTPTDIAALWLTMKLAAVSTFFLVILALPLAWWLSRFEHPVKSIVEAIIALPLVLPPTVLGFYLLILLAPDTAMGELWQWLFNRQLAFSFDALIIGSMIYSLPFVVQPIQQAFARVPQDLIQVYTSMGMTFWQRQRYLIVPLCRSSLVAALTLGFAHTIGEFGVVLMIGGNIPGETQVISIALYDHVETLNYTQAHVTSGILLVLSLAILITTYSRIGSPLRFVRRGSDDD